MIFVEDLDFRMMAKGMLGQHTLDAELGQFTNQNCHNCGFVKPRDVAAGQVIAARGQRGGEMACGADAAGAEVTQSSCPTPKPPPG